MAKEIVIDYETVEKQREVTRCDTCGYETDNPWSGKLKQGDNIEHVDVCEKCGIEGSYENFVRAERIDRTVGIAMLMLGGALGGALGGIIISPIIGAYIIHILFDNLILTLIMLITHAVVSVGVMGYWIEKSSNM